MASDFHQKSPFIYAKGEVNGQPYCFSTHVPKPKGWQTMTRSHLGKTAEAARAHEIELNYIAAAKGEISEEEFLAMMCISFRRLMRTLDKTSIALWFVRWTWERTIRNRPDRSKVCTLVKVMDGLLTSLRKNIRKPIYTLRCPHFNKFGRSLQKQHFSSAYYNSTIHYLRALARSLKDKIGQNLAKDLSLEMVPCGLRKAFPVLGLEKIINTLRKAGPKAKQWKTVIMVMFYTSLRPGEAISLRKRHFRTNGKIKSIRVWQRKIQKFRTVVISKLLWEYLEPLLKPLRPEDLLVPALYHMRPSGRSNQFKKLLLAAGIKLTPTDLDPARQVRYEQCLYALRKTFNVWQQACGRSKKQRAKGLGHADLSSLQTYDDDEDPLVLNRERKFLDLLPRIDS